MPKKARDPQEVKDKILHAALTLFSKEGCRHITMNDIANSIHISKRTLYETYNDRMQLLEDCCIHIKNESLNSIKEITQNTDDTILRFSVHMRILLLYGVRYHKFLQDLQEQHPDLYEKYYNLRSVMSRDELCDILKKGIDEGHILPIVPVEEFTRTLFLLGDMAYNAYPNDPKTQKIFVDFYSFILIRGIVSDSAISHYSKIMQNGSINKETSNVYNGILEDLVPHGENLKNYIINFIANNNNQITGASEKLIKTKHKTIRKKEHNAAPNTRHTKKRPTVKDKYEAKMKEREEAKEKDSPQTTVAKSTTARRGRPRKNVDKEKTSLS